MTSTNQTPSEYQIPEVDRFEQVSEARETVRMSLFNQIVEATGEFTAEAWTAAKAAARTALQGRNDSMSQIVALTF